MNAIVQQIISGNWNYNHLLLIIRKYGFSLPILIIVGILLPLAIATKLTLSY